jgi:hypothetical protein
MIWDGWEGNPLALSLAAGWFGWCGMTKIWLTLTPTFDPIQDIQPT